MGKRKRRLHSPKYAKKYASVRATYNRLRGVIEEAEADGVITEEEAKQINLVKQEVIAAVVEEVLPEDSKADDAVEGLELIKEVEEMVAPVVKRATKKITTTKKKTSKRKRKPTKTEG